METKIAIEEGNILKSVRIFLKNLLESGIVQALLVPLEADDGTISPGLVTNSEQLVKANPIAPVMPINNARVLAALTGKVSPMKSSAPATIGAILRPCEIRAAIELVKLQQANFENIILIGLDCPGTYESGDYYASDFSDNGHLSEYFLAAKEGRDPRIPGLELRSACQFCLQQKPENVAIHLNLFGIDSNSGIAVTIQDQVAAILNLQENTGGGEFTKDAFEHLLSTHRKAREKGLAEIQLRMATEGGISSVFSTCIRCHNCQEACPICYCKLCLFESEAFRHEPGYYLRSAQKKGWIRFLPDTLLYHMTRLNHMSLSCVSCGMCSSACPEHIPVSTIFTVVGSRVQEAFGYLPGQSIEDRLPLTCFQPGEWVEVGEEK